MDVVSMLGGVATDLSWLAALAQAPDALPAGGAGIDWLKIAMRSLHSLGGIAIVGSLLYLRIVYSVSRRTLRPEEDDQLMAALRRPWARLVGISAALLIATGFYNLFEVVRLYEVPKYYHPLFGIKFLLALFVFFVASLLAGRTAVASRFQVRTPFWTSMALAASVVIVVLGAILRTAPRTPHHLGEPAKAVASVSDLQAR